MSAFIIYIPTCLYVLINLCVGIHAESILTTHAIICDAFEYECKAALINEKKNNFCLSINRKQNVSQHQLQYVLAQLDGKSE